MHTGKIIEIGDKKQQKYTSYKDEYIPFFSSLKQTDNRKLDKALFAFGQFLNIASNYV